MHSAMSDFSAKDRKVLSYVFQRGLQRWPDQSRVSPCVRRGGIELSPLYLIAETHPMYHGRQVKVVYLNIQRHGWHYDQKHSLQTDMEYCATKQHVSKEKHSQSSRARERIRDMLNLYSHKSHLCYDFTRPLLQRVMHVVSCPVAFEVSPCSLLMGRDSQRHSSFTAHLAAD